MEYVALMALNSIDILTGIIAAKLTNQKINSRKAKNGVLRKIAEWLAVVCAISCQYVMGNLLGYQLPAAAVAVAWLSFCEIVSILENLGRAGVRMPQKLLNQLKDVLDSGDDKKD